MAVEKGEASRAINHFQKVGRCPGGNYCRAADLFVTCKHISDFLDRNNLEKTIRRDMCFTIFGELIGANSEILIPDRLAFDRMSLL